MKFVRLKPYNGRSNVTKSYSVFGIKFESSKGWYKVDDDVATYLASVRQEHHGLAGEESPLAFDVVESQKEAEHIEAREKARAQRLTPGRAERKIRVHEPGVRTPTTQVRTRDKISKGPRGDVERVRATTAAVPKYAYVDSVVEDSELLEEDLDVMAEDDDLSPDDADLESDGTEGEKKAKKKKAKKSKKSKTKKGSATAAAVESEFDGDDSDDAEAGFGDEGEGDEEDEG